MANTHIGANGAGRTAFPSWTIYNSPIDMPGQFVARKYLWDQPTNEFVTGATLEEVRMKLPRGLACLPRQPGDHPSVVEVWI